VGTLACGFVFDDHVLIVTNDAIRSWHYFPTYFTSHIWSFRYPHLLANYYRPLFLLWLRLNYLLFGLHAWGWHLTSVLAHVAVTGMVYAFARRLTGTAWAAGVAALIFGLHPVHAEAVADITSIQEPLSTLLILAAVLALLRGRAAGGKSAWLGVAWALAAAALLAKESAMVVPVLVAGYAWIYAQSGGREVAGSEKDTRFLDRVRAALVASVPFWLVVLLYVPARVHALKGFAHITTPVRLTQEILTVPSVLLFYLRLLVWPAGLSCYYDTPYVSRPSGREFVMPAVLLVAVALAAVYWYRCVRRSNPGDARAIVFAGFWMAVTLLPVLNFRLLPENELAHDRYLYLPSVGFVVLVALAARRVRDVLPEQFRRLAWTLAAGFVLAGIMGTATMRQSLFWFDDLTLNRRAHQIAPHNIAATTSLAAALAQRGMDFAAVQLYHEVLAARPNFWRATVNLAYIEYHHGNVADAAQLFQRSCAIDPTDGDQFLYLGMALLRLGQKGEAEKAVRTALLVRPDGRNYHLGLAMVLKAEGQDPGEEAAAEVAAHPDNDQARDFLKHLYIRRGTMP
jgi:Flp pilus assembly protein TadD